MNERRVRRNPGTVLAPEDLLNLATGVAQSAMLGVAAKAGVADLLATGPLGAAEIARRTGFSPDATHRLMRALASLGVFEMDADGRFSNNEASGLLRSDADWLRMRATAQYFGSSWSLRTWAVLEDVMRGGEVAFQRAHHESIWDFFDRHPEAARCFAEQMNDMTSVTAPVLAESSAFAELSSLCDVAGGTGALLARILVRHPRTRGILFDTGITFDEADRTFRQCGVRERVEMIAGSFFDFVPGSDAYLLKDILHDWDDERAGVILGNVRRASRPGARLLIVEAVFEPSELDRHKAISDLTMFVLHGGRQRSQEDFRRLLQESGFRLEGVERLRASTFGVVVATAV